MDRLLQQGENLEISVGDMDRKLIQGDGLLDMGAGREGASETVDTLMEAR